jgi:hypothetical protein
MASDFDASYILEHGVAEMSPFYNVAPKSRHIATRDTRGISLRPLWTLELRFDVFTIS